jgi:hypothetical protein
MKLRREIFEKRIDILSEEFEGPFLSIQILDLWFERYGSKSMPTRTQMGMLLKAHPRITSFHFNTRRKVKGIRGDTRRYQRKD